MNSKILKIIMLAILITQSQSYANDFVLTPEKTISGINYEKASISNIFSKMLNKDESEVTARTKELYRKLTNNEPILATEKSAKAALLIKYISRFFCEADSENTFEELLKYLSNRPDFSEDLESLNHGNNINLNTETFPLLLMMRMGCDEISHKSETIKIEHKKYSHDSNKTIKEDKTSYSEENRQTNLSSEELADPFSYSSIQTGTIIINDSQNTDGGFMEKMTKIFGSTIDDHNTEKNKALNEIKENGFLEVDDSQIGNLDEFYEKNKKLLKSVEETEQELSFSPSKENIDSNYVFLGSTVSGVANDSGFSAIQKIYDTPLGKISIIEEDITSSEAIVSVEKEFLNYNIGKNPASIIVSKGKDNGEFNTEIFWVNPTNNRTYTVELSDNIQDERIINEKKDLLNFLSSNFENDI